MPTQSESPAPAAVSGTSPKMLQLLRKRLRQLLRVALVLAIGLAVAASALAIWWLTSLNGLPDIGDPFDVAAFRAFSVPDDRNAFTYFRRASEKLTPVRGLVVGQGADPAIEVLVVDREPEVAGVGRGESRGARTVSAGGRTIRRREPGRRSHGRRGSGLLIMLALLEASRRQESGDTAGAWDCYRAVLRMITHFRRRGSTLQRDCARRSNRWLQRRLTDWAADPRTTIPQLHTALEVVLENEPDPDWDLFAIKSGYLELMRVLERPIPPLPGRRSRGNGRSGSATCRFRPRWSIISRPRAASSARARTQPARPAAALCQLPGARGSPRAAAAETGRPGDVLLPGHQRTRSRRARSACRFTPSVRRHRPGPARYHRRRWPAGWSQPSTPGCDSCVAYIEWHWPPDRVRTEVFADRRAHRDLVIMLATEIYRRERGSLPPSEEALVGTYLKSLPDDGSAELADETTPTVE